jgi:hypothetical protein
MNRKDIEYIYDRLRVVQGSSNRVSISSVFDIKYFLEILEKNALINELKFPTEIFAENNVYICFDWYKNINKKKLDILSLYFSGDNTFTMESFLDSIGTHTIKQYEIKEDLDEVFLVHLKHFN